MTSSLLLRIVLSDSTSYSIMWYYYYYYYYYYYCYCVIGIATPYGWDIRVSNAGGGGIFRTCPHRPGLTQPLIQWVQGLSRG